MLDFVLVRVLFVCILSIAAANVRAEGDSVWVAALLGAAIAATALIVERRLARVALKRLFGMVAGFLTGLLCAALISSVLGRIGGGAWTGVGPAQIACLTVLAYFGASLGAAKGDLLNAAVFGSLFGAEADTVSNRKILDTSVIIDGRIADIAETGFLDGVLIVPQFVLHELQMVADSSDSMKRTRGRRGLDVLQRIQKMPRLKVEVVSEDFPGVPDVDMKLIELARLFNCKIVTNDFNLNKVAHVRGVEVLNINELTNSLKPVVLPGELMRVFILKEGKEYNQGVAYLDDGTMVVVDNARRMIAKTIDISVTSVLQTTAGKMIFGKYDERIHAAAAGTGSSLAQPRREQAAGE